MKCLILALVCACVVIASAGIVEQIEIVNNAKTTWRAEKNKFSSYTTEQLVAIFGAPLPDDAEEHKISKSDESVPFEFNGIGLPESFDSRDKWPECIHPIRDQGSCGSCWAFSSTEALSDRFCIFSNGSVNVVLSPQDMVSCDWYSLGCNGGLPNLAWLYFQESGVVSESCFPYADANGDKIECISKCENGNEWLKYKVSSYKHVGTTLFLWHNVTEIMEEIMLYGPVQAGFLVYEDLMSYKSGVYQHVSGKFLGAHAVKIVGWGVDHSTGTGVPYWTIANSWGTDWGLDGYFWMIRGTNDAGIEEEVYCGVPEL